MFSLDPSNLLLVVSGCGNGLLEHLVILGYCPIPIIVVWDMGVVQQHR